MWSNVHGKFVKSLYTPWVFFASENVHPAVFLFVSKDLPATVDNARKRNSLDVSHLPVRRCQMGFR